MEIIKQNSIFNRILPEQVIRLHVTPYFAHELMTADEYQHKQNITSTTDIQIRQSSVVHKLFPGRRGGEKMMLLFN